MSDPATIAAGACHAAICAASAAAPAAAATPWWWAPVLAAGLAVFGAWMAIAFDRRKSINQELIKKRIVLYDEVVPMANDVLCYFTAVGGWKALTPTDLLAHKRALDRFINVHGALFSDDLTTAHRAFIMACFRERNGPGEPARLRANRDVLKYEFGPAWKDAWNVSFVEVEYRVDSKTLRSTYDEFLRVFAREIGTPLRRWRRELGRVSWWRAPSPPPPNP